MPDPHEGRSLHAEYIAETTLADLAATAALAGRVARAARPGDFVGLAGPLGAGKTTFARLFLEARASQAGVPAPEEVPSPTFTLVQVYEIGPDEFWHFDLYRIAGPAECVELGFEDALDGGIVLAEWPERLGPLVPGDRLALDFRVDAGEVRMVRMTGFGHWAERVAGLAAV